MSLRGRREREREIKRDLVKVLREAGTDPREVAEWLWEDFGKRVRPEWKKIERAVLEDDVTPQDLVVFLYDAGIDFDDEKVWRREYEALRRGEDSSRSG